MSLPAEWNPSDGESRTLAERLMAWRPETKRIALLEAGGDSNTLLIRIPSPTSDEAREVSIRIGRENVQLSFGPALLVLSEKVKDDPTDLSLETLEGIATGRILKIKRSGLFNNHPWEVIDTKGKRVEDVLMEKYRWGRFEVKSWSGESDAVLRFS